MIEDREDDRKKLIYNMGYRDGVYDHDRELSKMEGYKSLGKPYSEGYDQGYSVSHLMAWYVVSLDKKNNQVSSYYLEDNEINSWTKTKKEATVFKTEAKAREICDRLMTNCGRSNYKVIWRVKEE